jgi:alpha-methylacyl-CoA racemase
MGPLSGLKVVEMKGIGPGPYAGMLLADMGAEVIVIERARKPSSIAVPSEIDVLSRGKKSVALDLKKPGGIDTLLGLIDKADIFIDVYRPGVTERLGFGPDVCLARNPKLIYGRMTGWGQTGPLAQSAGHDINYISIAGALAAIGRADKPVPPLNLVGDFAGGSLFLVMGILAALHETRVSGKGQVVDAAISDGSANLMSIFYSLAAVQQWSPSRESNLLDGAAHFYDVYETADGKFISLGAIEPQFYGLFLEKAGLDPEVFGEQLNPRRWPELKRKLEQVIKTKTRSEWASIMEGTDACCSPVLDYTEAPQHPHNKARQSFIEVGGAVQPAPAPRFSRTGCKKPSEPSSEGADTESVLLEWGMSQEQIDKLLSTGTLPL